MTYTIRWQSTDGTQGPPIGQYATLDEAKAAQLEHGTRKAGVWTADGALYRDDLDDRYLGRYVIEVAPDEPDERTRRNSPTTRDRAPEEPDR